MTYGQPKRRDHEEQKHVFSNKIQKDDSFHSNTQKSFYLMSEIEIGLHRFEASMGFLDYVRDTTLIILGYDTGQNMG